MRHDLFVTICNTLTRTVPATNKSETRQLQNTNGLINKNSVMYPGYFYEPAAGVKTGHTEAAGYCLISTAEQDDVRMLCVVLGAGEGTRPNGTPDYYNFTDSIALYRWVFDNFSRQTLLSSKELVADAPVEGVTESYPGSPLSAEMFGDGVYLVQIRLNRISKNFPNIPKIAEVNGFFSAETVDAVEDFQRQFGLTPDGVVGRATWYAIARIYSAVKKLSDLNSEGVPVEDVILLFNDRLYEGLTGNEVREVQYLLDFISGFSESVRPVEIDGIFGPVTRGAVEDFQYIAGLPVTGEVDMSTWEAIYAAFRNFRASLPDDYFVSQTVPYPGTALRQGSRGEDVRTIQTYLNRIAEVYAAIPSLAADGIFGPKTADAVRAYQRIYGLDPTGVVASYTWESIANTYRTLVEGDYGSEDQFGGVLAGEEADA